MRVTPAYAATPYPINFGAVTINTTAVQDIVIENVGSGTCALTAPSIEADFLAMGASAFAILQAPPTTLGAGQIATMQVGFTPTSTGSFGGGSFGYVALLLPTADTASFPGDACTVHGLLSNITGAPGCVGWTLQGTGVESAVPTTMLAAVPESLVARPARSQCNSLNTVQLYNMGNQSMTITGVEVIPSTASFAIVSPSTQVVLSAGTSTPISVRFQPGSSSISATIRITASSNGSSVTLDIPASGTVATSANQVDSFVQNASTKADLLFIVDDSGSMTEEQAQFAPGASALLQYAATLGIDYRAAVITTDMEDPTRSGRFQGTPRVITRSDADPSTEISQTILALGTSGSGTEQGLAAAKTALSSPLITDSLTNGGFLRPEAKLGIIVLSDEDDQSTGPTNYYLDFLRQLKASSGGKELSFSAIVGPASGMNSGGEPGCLSGNYEAVTGSRYIAVQEATGGVFESICTLDATRFGQALAQRIVPNRSTFALSRVPSGAISVRVNGSTQTAFSYDSALNAVVFNTAAVPSAGSSVEVSYSVACSAP